MPDASLTYSSLRWALLPLLAGAFAATAQAQAPAQPPAANAPFDAAPFGLALDKEGPGWVGVKWPEPRKIRRVVVEVADGAAVPDDLRVQYWHDTWDGKPEPVLSEKGAGGVGWESVDDWTNGAWKDADTRKIASAGRVEFTFEPTGRKEFPKSAPGVSYRRTLKLRVLSASNLSDARLRLLTDSVYQPLSVRIRFGKPAHAGVRVPAQENGRLEVMNGAVLAVRALAGAEMSEASPQGWRFPTAAESGVEADLLIAVDPLNPGFDRTTVTVRSDQRPFSFAADQVASGQRILVDDLGVLVTRCADAVTLAQLRDSRKESAARTVYQRVFDEPEQSLAQAWDAMPLKRPLYFVHGLPGNRNTMRQMPGGDLALAGRHRWLQLPVSPRDSARRMWEGEMLELDFGFPRNAQTQPRELADGYLPLLNTSYQDGVLEYRQETVLDALSGSMEKVALDDPSLLLMRVRIVNTSATETATARLLLTSQHGKERLKLAPGRRIVAECLGQDRLRYIVTGMEKGELAPERMGLRWTLGIEPGAAHELCFAIPSITLDKEEEIAALSARDFAAGAARVCGFWKETTARGCTIHTPEPWLNDFFKAHVRHLLVNCFQEIGSERLHAHVGTFNYGVFPDESVMMIHNLDMRGYADEARRCYQSFLDYQGTEAMPGNFASKEGTFYGAGGHSDGGYNKSHAWVMWGMAQHWRLTRDRDWMATAAPKLVAACDWVVRERQATMKTSRDGSRPIEYGLLPTGSLEDVHDYWSWLVTNACTDWGFQALSGALAEFGHPEAARLQKESQAFHQDLMRGFEESRVQAAVVALRDGTCVPKYPSRLYERGRCHGWLRETLEGSIHLLITGLLDPRSPQADWILKDFEDNLYISSEYGYAIPSFDTFWFSRGGFSMQANLLGGPLPYLDRDEVKHFLRAYFNAFASAFYPDIRMCNEHSLPELGYQAGDHFKSSDEAQSTWWLRLMFIREQGGALYLGQAIPREWLQNGKTVSIDRAATQFGQLSLRIASAASDGRISAEFTRAPSSAAPPRLYLRLRHPEAKPIRQVTVDGKPHTDFDAAKEWVILPGATTQVKVVAHY